MLRTTKNTVKEIPVEEHPDPNIKVAYWWNQDKAQTHYFTSILNEHYPHLKEGWPAKTLTCPPNRVLMLPHRYYRMDSRDGTPLTGAWVTQEAIHEIPPSMLTRGGALGFEN